MRIIAVLVLVFGVALAGVLLRWWHLPQLMKLGLQARQAQQSLAAFTAAFFSQVRIADSRSTAVAGRSRR